MKSSNSKNRLAIVVPCYNEEKVLPITFELFSNKIYQLVSSGKISSDSFILYIDDGSKDNTWSLIYNLSKKHTVVKGASLSRNRGHQFALLAGLMEAKNMANVVVSMDCDGQDDINAIDNMLDKYYEGYDVIYGVRSSRNTDSFFKRFTAELYYKILNALGAETVFNHADYRMTSVKVLNEIENYKEVNLYLRGLFPLVGFKSTTVYYSRNERMAGKSHYPLSKMVALAFEGITSLSIKPINIIVVLGFLLSCISLIFVVVFGLRGNFSNTNMLIKFISSILTLCLGLVIISIGVVGEYVGKTYLETKHRPRYIINDKTY